MSQKGKKGGQDNVWGKQEEPLQAVVIADSFNQKFTPITLEKPRVLLPLIGKCILDYTLEYLLAEGVQEIFIFCCAHSDQIKNHVKNSWCSLPSHCSISMVTSSSQDCISLGDALREIDREGLIRSDFILIPGDTISTVKLQEIIEAHKERRKKEKTCMMTLLYRTIDPGHFSRCREDSVVLAIDSTNGRILYCQKAKDTSKFSIPLGLFCERNAVQIRYDLSDTYICICSPMVPALFTDNFDYQTKEDFMRGILINEEIMGNQLYGHVVEDSYSARVTDLHMYSAVSLDIMNRWSYPIVPDNGPFSFFRHNIYKGEDIRLDRDIFLDENVVIGKGSVVESRAYISNSVIGSNCKIGTGVTISNSYLWDNVTVGENSEVRDSLICSGCTLKRNVKVSETIVSYGVTLGPDVSVPAKSKISLLKQDSLEDGFDSLDISDNSPGNAQPDLVLGSDTNGHFWFDEDEEAHVPGLTGDFQSETEEESSDESVASMPPSPPAEPSNLFYMEVLENVRHGIAEKVTPDNIILEVNASKYKYNVSIKEINQSVVKSVVQAALGDSELSSKEALSQFVKINAEFKPLILNYIRGEESQHHCVSALEEYFAENQSKAILFPSILHKLYDGDVLEEHVILHWFKQPVRKEDPLLEESCKTLRTNQSLMKFIQWLEETEEESDSSG